MSLGEVENSLNLEADNMLTRHGNEINLHQNLTFKVNNPSLLILNYIQIRKYI